MTMVLGVDYRWLLARWRVLAALAGLGGLLVLPPWFLMSHGNVIVFGRSEPAVIMAVAPAAFLVPVAAALGAFIALPGTGGWTVTQALWSPNRGRAIVSKAAVAAVAAAALALVLSSLAVTSYAAGHDVEVGGEVVVLAFGSAAAFAVWTLLSSAVTTVMGSRPAGVLLVFCYWAVAQPALTSLNHRFEMLLPGGVVGALAGSGAADAGVVQAVVVLGAWLSGAWALAWWAFRRRDLTL
jgi:hypothetical protein